MGCFRFLSSLWPSGKRVILFFPLVLIITACFEPPVQERLDLIFLPDHLITLRVTSRIEEPAGTADNETLTRRLQESRKEILEGWDLWTRRFERMAALRERTVFERTGGKLIRYEHEVVISGPESLRGFFDYTDLRTYYSEREGNAEFSIVAADSTRATREQRKRVDDVLDPWCVSIVDYLDRLRTLYRYVESNPERARTCMGHLLNDILSAETRSGLDDLTEVEQEMVQPVEDAMADVYRVLLVNQGEAFTLNELSDRVFNPFPAEFHVSVPGKILETEGFTLDPDGTLTTPGLSIWNSYRILQDELAHPDPLSILIETHLTRTRSSFDLDPVIAEPRSVHPPATAPDLRTKIDVALTPAPLYRVKWKIPAQEAGRDEEAGSQR